METPSIDISVETTNPKDVREILSCHTAPVVRSVVSDTLIIPSVVETD